MDCGHLDIALILSFLFDEGGWIVVAPDGFNEGTGQRKMPGKMIG